MKLNLSKIALALSLAFATQTLVMPRRAEAIVGVAHGNVPMIVVGSILAAGGLAVALSGVVVGTVSCSGMGCFGPGLYMLFAGSGGGLIALVGIILLDGPSGARIDYMQLTEEQRLGLGITTEEAESFDAEREEVATATDTGTFHAFNAGVTTAEAAKPFFEREYEALSPLTRSYMSKVVSANLR